MQTNEIWRSPERLRAAFKQWRKKAGLSQAEVADMLHLRPQAVGCFERGESNMSRATRQQLVEVMKQEGGESFLNDQTLSSPVPRPSSNVMQSASQARLCPHACPQDSDIVRAQMECMRLGREDLLDEIMNLIEEVAELRAQAGRLNGRLFRIMADIGIV